MKKIILIIITLACITACEKSNIGDTIPYRLGFSSIIDYYYIPSTPLITNKENSREYRQPYTIGEIDSYLIISCIDSAKIFKFNEYEPYDMGIFESYAKYFGDTIFSNEHEIDNQYYASVMPLTAINVVTERQYDMQHPAGSVLNDIIYIHTARNNEMLVAKQYYQAFDRRIDSISNTNPINMLNGIIYIHFIKQPDNPGVYSFSISMEFGADPVTGETKLCVPVAFDFQFEP